MTENQQSPSVAVTGAAGFVGSFLVRRLWEQGLRGIQAIDSAPDAADRRCTAPFRSWGLSIIDPWAFLDNLRLGLTRVDVVYHMGAISRTDETSEEKLDTCNVNYSKDLWKICADRGIRLVYASSASTYGAGELGFADDPALCSRLRPLNLYGWSKQRFDAFVLEEVSAGRTPPSWAGLKFFNVYGPGETHKGSQASLIHSTRAQLRDKGIVKLFRSHRPDFADGRQTRDFVYVGDVAKTCFAFGEGKLVSGIYNVGTGEARTWIELVNAVGKSVGVEPKIEFIDIPESLKSHYQYRTQADLKRLRAAGCDRPFVGLDEGVKRSFEEEDALT